MGNISTISKSIWLFVGSQFYRWVKLSKKGLTCRIQEPVMTTLTFALVLTVTLSILLLKRAPFFLIPIHFGGFSKSFHDVPSENLPRAVLDHELSHPKSLLKKQSATSWRLVLIFRCNTFGTRRRLRRPLRSNCGPGPGRPGLGPAGGGSKRRASSATAPSVRRAAPPGPPSKQPTRTDAATGGPQRLGLRRPTDQQKNPPAVNCEPNVGWAGWRINMF